MAQDHPLGTKRAAGIVLAAALAVGGVGIAAPAPAFAAKSPELSTVIIELDGAPALTRFGDQNASELRRGDAASSAKSRYRGLETEISTTQDAALSTMRSSGVAVKDPKHVTGVLNAVIGRVDAGQLDAIRQQKGIARVTLDGTVHALEDQSRPRGALASVAVPAVAAPAVSVPAVSAPAPTAGSGSTIAILDTGIDYTLADLGAGFGAGFKVVDGYDFVNNDADPMDDHYHGTHVAGIAAGTGVDSVTGAAPGAQLTAYKVLDGDGSGYDSDIILALEAASDPAGSHPADVINMSLGGSGDGTDPVSRAAATASDSGSVVVAAAGNSGPSEATIGAPAIAPEVLAVGASVSGFTAPTATLVSPTKHDLVTSRVPFSASAPAGSITATVVDAGDGTQADFDRLGDIRGKIVAYNGAQPYLGYFSLEIPRLAESRGAVAALVHVPSPLSEDNASGPVTKTAAPGVVDLPAPTNSALTSGDDNRLDSLVVLSLTDSEYALFSAQAAAATAKVTITSTDVTDQIASFSSRGQTVHDTIKPDVVAPGYEIRSTVPGAQGIPGNTYRLSGTSMASPYVAGSVAVLAAARPDLGPDALRELVIGNTVELKSSAKLSSPSSQGSGKVTTERAAAATVSAHPATLGFGQADAASPAASMQFTLTNSSPAAVTARLEARPSDVSQGTLTVAGDQFTIAAGASVTRTALAEAKVGATDSELSGEIVVTLSTGVTVRIPYLQSSQTLKLSSTPTPSTGIATIFVRSFTPMDAAPKLTITPQRGAPFALAATESSTEPGVYSAAVNEKRVGVYRISATAKTGGKTIVGAGSFEVIASATTDKTWQQLGRNAAAGQIAVSPSRPGTAMQVTSSSSRPFVTTDHGTTWKHIQSIPVADGTGIIVADPNHGDGFWYFMSGAYGNSVIDPSYAGKLLRTDDLGKTWRTLPMPNMQVRSVAIDGNRLVAVTADGALVSPDGGKTWSAISHVWGDAGGYSSTIFHGDLYVTDYDELIRVGSVFTHPGAPTNVIPVVTGVSYSTVSSGADFIAVTGWGGLQVSTTGTKWTTTAFDPAQPAFGLTVIGGDIFVSGINSNYLRSGDLGKTWTSTDYPISGTIATTFAKWPDRASSLLLPLPYAGLYASANNGKSFTRIGAASTNIFSVLATTNQKGDPTVIVADDSGVNSAPLPAAKDLPDNATEWGLSGTEGRFGVQSSDIAQDAVAKDTLWRTSPSFGSLFIARSTDAGATWSPVGPLSTANVLDIEASQKVAGHVAASVTGSGDKGIIVSHDGFVTWKTYSQPITVRRIAIDPHVDSRLWLAADDGLYRSDDDGKTITRVLSGETRTVWVDPSDAKHIVVGGGGVWVSTDGGASFTVADSGAADTYLTSLTSAVVTNKNGKPSTVLFAGSAAYRTERLLVLGRGVLASIDGGASWHNVSAGIGTTSVLSLDASSDGKWLLTGTRQGGLYRASVADLLGLIR